MPQIVFEENNKIPEHKPEEYVYIKKWGEMMGLLNYYVKESQLKASKECAPITATHFLKEKGWQTIDDIPDPQAKKYFCNEVKKGLK
jgi:hypothetical protein